MVNQILLILSILTLFFHRVSADDLRVAVLGQPEEIRLKVESSLMNLPYCKVIEIQNRAVLLKEISLGQTGILDETKIARAGKLLGAEKIITVSKKENISSIRMTDIESGVVEGIWYSENSSLDKDFSQSALLIKKMLEGLLMNRALAELKSIESSIKVSLIVPKSSFKKGEEITFEIISEESGFLTIIDIQPDGSIVQLLPNKTGMSNKINAGQSYFFPDRTKAKLFISPPFGKDTLRAIVSKKPLNLFKKEELEGEGISTVKSGLGGILSKGIFMKFQSVPSGDWGMAEISFTTSE
ncbi:MAG: DUF4384 domain-containing protein [Spirochaetia bacterium]|nr:DUF4384 domain-containing protein [Spirochaetia bacterium]